MAANKNDWPVQGYTSPNPKYPRLADLLVQGERILAGKEELARERAAQAELRRSALWEQLLAAARVELGELLDGQPKGPPSDFDGNGATYVFRLQLYVAGQVGSRWVLVANNSRDWSWYQAAFDGGVDGEKSYEVVADGTTYTDSLAEAVALCKRAADNSKAAAAEGAAGAAAEATQVESERRARKGKKEAVEGAAG